MGTSQHQADDGGAEDWEDWGEGVRKPDMYGRESERQGVSYCVHTPSPQSYNHYAIALRIHRAARGRSGVEVDWGKSTLSYI